MEDPRRQAKQRSPPAMTCSCPASCMPPASGGRSVRVLVGAIGLFGDPCEVVRVAVDDRSRGYTGDLVGMLAAGACNDLGHSFTAGVQRYPALGPLVYLTLPSVDRPYRGEVVRAGGQAVLDQLPGECVEPVRVRCGDHDLA